jgi:hypothetical protein
MKVRDKLVEILERSVESLDCHDVLFANPDQLKLLAEAIEAEMVEVPMPESCDDCPIGSCDVGTCETIKGFIVEGE